MLQESRLLWPESSDSLGRIDMPAFEYLLRKRQMHGHPPVVFEGNQVVIEQCVNVGREQHSVLTAGALCVA